MAESGPGHQHGCKILICLLQEQNWSTERGSSEAWKALRGGFRGGGGGHGGIFPACSLILKHRCNHLTALWAHAHLLLPCCQVFVHLILHYTWWLGICLLWNRWFSTMRGAEGGWWIQPCCRSSGRHFWTSDYLEMSWRCRNFRFSEIKCRYNGRRCRGKQILWSEVKWLSMTSGCMQQLWKASRVSGAAGWVGAVRCGACMRRHAESIIVSLTLSNKPFHNIQAADLASQQRLQQPSGLLSPLVDDHN